MKSLLKELAISILEKHPYGYTLGLAIMESSSVFLPHESDFYAMPLIASPSISGLFLDIGANRGHSALGFQKIMPSWHTISIEANPIHEPRLERLKKHKKLFNYHIAAADYESGKKVTIWTPRYGFAYCHSSTAVNRAEAERSIEISFPVQAKKFNYISNETATLAIDDLQLAPKIVKIDIQGKEIDAMRGMKKTIERHRPFFLIECNLDGANIIRFMQEIDYEAHLYERESHRIIKPEKNFSLINGRNIFFIPREQIQSLS